MILGCSKCQSSKPSSEFYKDRSRPCGFSYWCKECIKVKSREWKRSRNGKASGRKSKFGVDADAYEALLAKQGGVCAICAGVNASGRALAVDHDHSCCPGKKSCGACLRGLLCSACNLALGHMKDDVDRMQSAIDYIRYHRHQ